MKHLLCNQYETAGIEMEVRTFWCLWFGEKIKQNLLRGSALLSVCMETVGVEPTSRNIDYLSVYERSLHIYGFTHLLACGRAFLELVCSSLLTFSDGNASVAYLDVLFTDT